MSEIYDENEKLFDSEADAEKKNEINEEKPAAEEPTETNSSDGTEDSAYHFGYGGNAEGTNYDAEPYRSGTDFTDPPQPSESYTTGSAFSSFAAGSYRPGEQPQPGFTGNTNGTGGNPNPSYPPYQSYRPQTPPYEQPSFTPPAPQEPKSSAGKKVLFALLIVLVIAASLGIGVALGNRHKPSLPSGETSSPEATTLADIDVTVETTRANGQLPAVAIADLVRPSVVGVMSYYNGQLDGEGSGVIFCEDSTKTYTYIMTCAHVISDKGREFSVLTLDGKPYDAKLVGYDERTDIGVLRIEANGLPVATLGDSSTLKIGEEIYAIGNPGGSEYFGSMTSGIVSAIDRSISSTYTMKVIQHDAAINPGNSGGALVNTSGQIVGINSSKIADTEFEGMGFAVPMSTAKDVAQSLISYGYVPNRPMLGIRYSDVSSYQFYSMLVGIKDLPRGSLIISSVATNSDLADKDVKSGDLIIAVNGMDMDTSDILLDLIEKSKVGDELTLTICRVNTKSYKTSTFDVKVKLVEDKGDTKYAEDEQEETTSPLNPFPFGGSDYYSDFFRDFFGF